MSDPILDAPISPAYPVGYQFWIENWQAIEEAAKQWYREANGREPADTDVGHGLWRGLNEGDRWKTLRNAWQNCWPKQTPGWRPTRAQILDVKGSYCSRRDSTGLPVFEPFVGRFWLDGDLARVDDWINGAKALGCKNFTLAFQSNTYGSYPVEGFDFTGQEESFRELMRYVLDRELVPRVFLTSGDTVAEIQHVRPRAEALVEFKDAAIWYHGWETIGSQSPTYTSKQWYDAQQTMREVFGANAVLGMHVADAERCTWASARGYKPNEPVDGCYWNAERGAWVENDDPSDGDEVGAMRMLQIDVYSLQTRHGGAGPAGTLGDLNDTATWSGHLVEIADRFLPPGSVIPGLGRSVTGPDWFAGNVTRPVLDAFETIPYEYIRGGVSEDWAQKVSATCRAAGANGEGCYR